LNHNIGAGSSKDKNAATKNPVLSVEKMADVMEVDGDGALAGSLAGVQDAMSGAADGAACEIAASAAVASEKSAEGEIQPAAAVYADGAATVGAGPKPSPSTPGKEEAAASTSADVPAEDPKQKAPKVGKLMAQVRDTVPSARMRICTAMRQGSLQIFGGSFVSS